MTWLAGKTPHAWRSEEDELAAADRGLIVLEPTRVVLNCPIVKRDRSGGLPGLGLGPAARCVDGASRNATAVVRLRTVALEDSKVAPARALLHKPRCPTRARVAAM